MATVVKSFKDAAKKAKNAKKGKRAKDAPPPKATEVTPIVKEEPKKLAGVVKEKGKKPIVKEMDEKQRLKEIAELLVELEESDDPNEKKGIRRKLRARGHRGGLNKRKGKSKVKPDADEIDDDGDNDDAEDVD